MCSPIKIIYSRVLHYHLIQTWHNTDETCTKHDWRTRNRGMRTPQSLSVYTNGHHYYRLSTQHFTHHLVSASDELPGFMLMSWWFVTWSFYSIFYRQVFSNKHCEGLLSCSDIHFKTVSNLLQGFMFRFMLMSRDGLWLEVFTAFLQLTDVCSSSELQINSYGA